MPHNILCTISTLLLSDHCEALAWNDGHIELEDPARNFTDDSTLPRFTFDLNQARELRNWLNKPEIVRILEQ
jgi:hypothetical protein